MHFKCNNIDFSLNFEFEDDENSEEDSADEDAHNELNHSDGE